MSTPAAGRSGSVLGWLRGYDRTALTPDLLAGLTTAAVALPKAMAYATVAGLPVQIGLYAALAAPSSTRCSDAPGPQRHHHRHPRHPHRFGAWPRRYRVRTQPQLLTATASLSVLVGALLLAGRSAPPGVRRELHLRAGARRLQGRHRRGDHRRPDPQAPGHPHREGRLLPRSRRRSSAALPGASIPTLLLSLAMLVPILALKHWRPRFPAPLVAVALSIAATALFQLPSHGIKTFAAIPPGLPSLVRPELGLFGQLWPAALAIALMSFTETIAAGRAFAAPGQPRPAPNPELFATGVANVADGLIGGHALRGRHQPDPGPERRRPDPAGGPGRRRRHARHAVPLRPGDLPPAPGSPGGGGHRLFARAGEPARIPRHRRRAAHGVHLGGHRLRGVVLLLGTLRGHPGRRRHLARCARPTGPLPRGLRAGPQTRHRPPPSALLGAPGGRGVCPDC